MLLIATPGNGVRPCFAANASIQDLTRLNPFPVEFRFGAAAVDLQGALLAHCIGAVEDPVLPGGEAAEDACLQGLGPGEAQACFHCGERIGREARALFDGEANLVFPVDVVRGGGDEAELERALRVEELAARNLRRLAAEAGGEAREAVR